MTSAPFPPGNPAMQLVIAAYLYWQYNDDQYLQAFIDAYNTMGQGYVDCFNGLNLSVYTNGNIAGPLLDWIASGIYGFSERPTLPVPGTSALGAYGSTFYGAPPQYAGYVPATGGGFYATSDDTFKRIITWAFYKGDGKICSVPWLKRRIARFLNGINGTSYNIDQTVNISITFPATLIEGSIPEPSYTGHIKVVNTAAGYIFAAAVNSGALELPFQWQWTVELVPTGSIHFVNVGGLPITFVGSGPINWTTPLISFPYLTDSSGNLMLDSNGYPIVGSS